MECLQHSSFWDLTDFGNIHAEYWSLGDIFHRIHGPAIKIIADDVTLMEGWYQDNILYRTDGPALLMWCESTPRKHDVYGDPIFYEKWSHRQGGPTIIIRHTDTNTAFSRDYQALPDEPGLPPMRFNPPPDFFPRQEVYSFS